MFVLSCIGRCVHIMALLRSAKLYVLLPYIERGWALGKQTVEGVVSSVDGIPVIHVRNSHLIWM